ncbi:MAG: cupin domain-containing protein [Pseudomonadota bacterium]
MPKIDIEQVPESVGTTYPAPYDVPCLQRHKRHLSNAAGLTQFGVVLVTLPPGAWSAQRHWHTHEDEFVWVLSGELVLSTEDGREALRAGECAGFKGGVANGHHLVNESDTDAQFLVVGSRMDEDGAEYPDADLRALPGRYSGKAGYTTKAGERLK